MKYCAAIFSVCAALFAEMSQAAPISFGALSSNSDGSTEVIQDSLNNRDWLRLDVLAGLTYAETIAATSAGGAYEDFTIAGIDDAQALVEALLQGITIFCTPTATVAQTCANNLDIDLRNLLGNNHSFNNSFAWFLSDNGIGEEVGQLQFVLTSRVEKRNERSSIEFADSFSSSGPLASLPITWLVYRDPVQVIPVPATLPLVLAGFGAFAGLAYQKRKKSQNTARA